MVEWAAVRGAASTDARYVEREHESVAFTDGAIEPAECSRSRGVGIRVRHRGAWGLAATDRTDGPRATGSSDRPFV